MLSWFCGPSFHQHEVARGFLKKTFPWGSCVAVSLVCLLYFSSCRTHFSLFCVPASDFLVTLSLSVLQEQHHEGLCLCQDVIYMDT